jgi:hypothetical protein
MYIILHMECHVECEIILKMRYNINFSAGSRKQGRASEKSREVSQRYESIKCN